jgi:hypothetical protein
MARRVGWYFVFVGIVLLAIAFVLAMGKQPSGRMLMSGLASLVLGAWLLVRALSAAPAPPAPPPAEAKSAKPKPAAPEKPPPKPKGLAGLFRR